LVVEEGSVVSKALQPKVSVLLEPKRQVSEHREPKRQVSVLLLVLVLERRE